MKNWYKLSLPDTRLSTFGSHLSLNPNPGKLKSYQCILKPESVLSLDLLKIFNDLNLTPCFVVFFAIPNFQQININNVTIHSDIRGLGNNQWQTIHGGILFEVNPTTVATFRWFDTSYYKSLYPSFTQEDYSTEYNILHGVHFGTRGQRGLLPEIKEIDTAVISQPLLVRTNIGHCVTYDTEHGIRCGVSIRFTESFESFETLVNRLLPIIEK